MASTDMSTQYVNTMVFAVVAGILSLMLLLLIMYASDTVQQYSLFIMTVEGGLVLIIAVAIFQIIGYEQKHSKQRRDGTQNAITVMTCPDYWTMQADGKTCNGRVVTGAASNGQFSRFTVLGKTLPPNPDKQDPLTMSLAKYNNVTVKDACAYMDDPTHQVSAVPWIDLRSVCDSYRL